MHTESGIKVYGADNKIQQANQPARISVVTRGYAAPYRLYLVNFHFYSLKAVYSLELLYTKSSTTS